MDRHQEHTTSPEGYDWSRFGCHRLRTPAATLVDSPVGFHQYGWLATIWPAPDTPAGWTRLIWQADPVNGGWRLPARLAGGDIIEFGADHDRRVVRWYGIVDSYDAVEWLTLRGPYPDPGAAHADAERLLARLRFEPVRPRASQRPCSRVRRGT
ncbi:MAG: hypothetical protein ACLGHQ_04085 [Acidimicrobiia bacterium]